MAGQSDSKYGDRGRMSAITEGVTAPTTSTAGYLGDVRFDVNGNRWELIGIIGGLYYWALPVDVFPAVNVEYLSHIESGVLVYKKITSGVFSSTLLTSIAHNIANWADMKRSIVRVNDSGVQTSGYINTTTFSSAGMDSANYRIYAGTAFYTKPFVAAFYYTKI